MKIIKQQTAHSSSLLLFFAGWSAAPELFTRLKADEGTDVMICYDYREIDFGEDLTRYKEIHLIAWSMGVRMAELAIGGKYRLRTATAINGTPRPIDDRYGIPVDIFRGTLDNLTAEGLSRFNRRMCGSRDTLAGYEAVRPRPLEEVRDELQHIYDLCRVQPQPDTAPHVTPIRWTRALISSDDRIFPAANQHEYWDTRCPEVLEIKAPHYPFYLWNRWNEL